MGCNVQPRDRMEYVQNLVLDFFQQMEGLDVGVTLDTSLGPHGLGHSMVKRKTYHGGISSKLSAKGCSMKTLRPNDFADSKLKSIGDIATLVGKDLV